ncbi:MAG TPA: hydantoinase B/oxoprolinase family protein, partial [Terriglobales bacterium]|nr:hydantoinase B/oxoprolinase family protein [Terriglobales bacterium]
VIAPPGAAGGEPGARGQNRLARAGGRTTLRLAGKETRALQVGERLEIRTPGGGGWGIPD